MTRKPKRKSNNPNGRPVTVDASAGYLLKLSPKLLEAAREAAREEGISLAEWWRRGGEAQLAKRKGR